MPDEAERRGGTGCRQWHCRPTCGGEPGDGGHGDPGASAAQCPAAAAARPPAGAAACLLHAARCGHVAAIVSLAAFAHPQQVMERWLAEHRIPRRWIGQAILEHVQQVIGERFERIAPVNLVGRIDCPVLLVHGRHDRTVPLADALALQRAGLSTELLVVDGDHDLRAALVPHAPAIIDFLAAPLRAPPAAATPPPAATPC